MKKIISFIFLIFCLFIIGACSDNDENAEDYPTKAVTYSLPFDPGGQSDVEARRQEPYLKESLGQNVNIEYKPGGGGSVGWSELADKKPDGYFFSGINIPHIILQPLGNEDTGYETEDINPVAIFQATPIGIAVDKDSDIDSLDELVDEAKDSPGSITIAGSGTYTGHHIAFLQLQKLADIEMEYVPFDGAAPSLQAFLGGNTDVLLGNSDDLMEQEDEMKILAIGSEKTFEPLPDIPTFKEEGFDMTAGIDRGVAVPPETDEKIIDKLESSFLDILDEDGVEEKMYEEGFEPLRMGHDESQEYIEEMTEEYSEIIEEVED